MAWFLDHQMNHIVWQYPLLSCSVPPRVCVSPVHKPSLSCPSRLFQKHLELLKFHISIEYTSFRIWVRYFMWNFKEYLWDSIKTILAIQWKIRFLNTCNFEIVRGLRLKNLCLFAEISFCCNSFFGDQIVIYFFTYKWQHSCTVMHKIW